MFITLYYSLGKTGFSRETPWGSGESTWAGIRHGGSRVRLGLPTYGDARLSCREDNISPPRRNRLRASHRIRPLSSCRAFIAEAARLTFTLLRTYRGPKESFTVAFHQGGNSLSSGIR